MIRPPTAPARPWSPTHEVPVERAPLPVGILLSLAAAVFASSAIEFLPGGLLPWISEDLQVPIAVAGQLISLFAASVIVTAAPLSILTRRLPRKLILVLSLSFIGLSSALTAASTSFAFLVAARVVGGVTLGLFWSVVFAYVASLVPAAHLARATAVVGAGGSLAGVLGIPLGNALGQALGWRFAFATMAALTLIVVIILVCVLPSLGAPSVPAARAKRSHRDRTLGPALWMCVIIVIFVASNNIFGTYLAPWLLGVANFPPVLLPVLLLTGGAAGLLGLVAVGILADAHPRATILVAACVLVAVTIAYPFVARLGITALLFLTSAVTGLAFGGIPVMMQTRVMTAASASVRSIAAAAQTTAFQVGIGGGALLGGLLIQFLGIESLPWIAAVSLILATGLIAIWDTVRQRRL